MLLFFVNIKHLIQRRFILYYCFLTTENIYIFLLEFLIFSLISSLSDYAILVKPRVFNISIDSSPLNIFSSSLSHLPQITVRN